MAGDRAALLGLLLYVVIAVAPTLVFWLALRVVPAAVSAVADRRSRPPSAPPLEQVVADLRRLRRDLRGAPQRTRVRQVALVSAYDDVLLQVCDVVGVDAPPLATATGGERAFARLLTEAAVEQAGISLDPPRGGSAAA